MSEAPLHCAVIGPNEPPLVELEQAMRVYGERSPTYRDLRLSFINWDGVPRSYAELLTATVDEARRARGLDGLARPYHWGDLPNLGVACLVSRLRAAGFEAEAINHFGHGRERLAALLARRPACVAVTTTFYVSNEPAAEVIAAVREAAPGVPIVIGGPLVATLARRFPGPTLRIALEALGADIYVIESQGEATLTRLVERLAAGRSYDDLPNLAFFRAGKLVRTGVEAEANDLDSEQIDWDGLVEPAQLSTVQLRTARSCAFRCSFCAYPLRAGALTLASEDAVRRQLDALVERGGVERLVFIDDTFNVPLRRFKQLCRLLSDYPFRWYSYFRASNSDAEAAELMAASGCAGVFLGLESGSATILRTMNKAASVERYRRGIAELTAVGIPSFGSFIFGFPGETGETVAETLAFIEDCALDWYRIQPWYAEPGTPIMAKAEAHQLRGAGFRWTHATMDVDEACDRVEQAVLELDASRWLPQWSFDFWMLPYLAGRGISGPALGPWLDAANARLRAELRGAPAAVLDSHAAELRSAAAALVDSSSPPPPS